MNKRQREAEAALHDQMNLLPRKQLILVFCVLALTLLVMFIDQNGISQLLPTIAKDLDATQNISWAGTSSLIGNTIFQVLYGRLSDIFGRKHVYLSAVFLLSFSDIMCGISKNSVMLYVFRGLAGVAGGGIISLSMMIVSDVVTLERRGKYQGILGSMVGLGNLIGPLLAGVFAEKASWRVLFYLLCPTVACCGMVSWYFLPTTMPKGNFKEDVKKIDYWGVATASISLILLLIPISGGGSYFEWNSPMVISMLTIGGIFFFIFLYVEWKVSTLPMMPMNMWRSVPVAAILFQNFCFGIVFYGYLYYLPLYYQNVRRYTALKSAYLTLPLMVTQSIASICSGQYISRRKRYGECIWVGFILMTVGTALTTLFNRTIPIYANVLILMLMGIGNGNVFQPTIISLQAHSPKAQRAIVISIRNFLRCLGGAIGLAVCAAILQNVLRASLPPQFKHLAASTYAKPDYAQYSAADAELILGAYEKASHAVFTLMAPLCGVCLVTCVFVKDRGLTFREDEESALVGEKNDLEAGAKGAVGFKEVENGVGASTTSLPHSHTEQEKQESEKEQEIAIMKPAMAAVDPRL